MVEILRMNIILSNGAKTKWIILCESRKIVPARINKIAEDGKSCLKKTLPMVWRRIEVTNKLRQGASFKGDIGEKNDMKRRVKRSVLSRNASNINVERMVKKVPTTAVTGEL